jgi:hypothetical protein
MYSIKVRNAETGAFFWNVSISEFHAHATDTQALPGAPPIQDGTDMLVMLCVRVCACAANPYAGAVREGMDC